MKKINFENAPSTNTPLSAQILNQMQANIEEAINSTLLVKGTPGAGISFDDLMVTGESTLHTIGTTSGASIETLPGFPTGAYAYGTLITLNPAKSKASHYSTTQIYIPDIPHTNGIYFRSRVGGTWTKIAGTSVQPIV